MKYINRAVIFLSIASLGLVFAGNTSAQPKPVSVQLYVSPTGSDSNDGTAAKAPFKTIQKALDAAKPGTVINLSKGIYRETLTTKVSGTASLPITIRGTDVAKDLSKRHQTILYGKGRIVNVDHDFYKFEGFAIDGQEGLVGKTIPTDPALVVPFKDANRESISDGRLIYIGSSDTSKNVTGIKIDNMFLQGAGGECVRLRNSAHHNEVTNSVIQYCGMNAKPRDDGFAYHNAEGVYIGTSPKSTNQPMFKNDDSNNNVVRNNVILTFGAECFNIKENAHHNSFVNNECRYNLEPLKDQGSNVELRGDHNLVEDNTISDSEGWNVKLRSDSAEYDKGGNIVRRNTLSKSKGPNIRDQSTGAIIADNKLDKAPEVVKDKKKTGTK